MINVYIFRITPVSNTSSNISFVDVFLSDPGRGVLMTSFPIVRYERIVVDACICPIDDFLLGNIVRLLPKLPNKQCC